MSQPYERRKATAWDRLRKIAKAPPLHDPTTTEALAIALVDLKDRLDAIGFRDRRLRLDAIADEIDRRNREVPGETWPPAKYRY
jgi:hypothetical protein